MRETWINGTKFSRFSLALSALIGALALVPAAQAAVVDNPGDAILSNVGGHVFLGYDADIPQALTSVIPITVASDGTFTANTAGIHIDTFMLEAMGFSIPVEIQPIEFSGQMSAGQFAMRIQFNAKINFSLFGDNCIIGPIDVNWMLGTIGSDGAVSVSNSEFYVPKLSSSDCGDMGETLNGNLGLGNKGESDVKAASATLTMSSNWIPQWGADAVTLNSSSSTGSSSTGTSGSGSTTYYTTNNYGSNSTNARLRLNVSARRAQRAKRGYVVLDAYCSQDCNMRANASFAGVSSLKGRALASREVIGMQDDEHTFKLAFTKAMKAKIKRAIAQGKTPLLRIKIRAGNGAEVASKTITVKLR